MINNKKSECLKSNLSIPYMLTAVPFMYLGFILPVFSKEMGLDSIQIAGLYSVFSLIVLMIRPFIGNVCDRVGRKSLLILSLILYIISFISYSMVTNVAIMYISRILQAIASPIMGISFYCMIIDTNNDNLGEVFGKLSAYNTVGSIIGVVIACLIFMNDINFLSGWQYFLYICCIIFIFTIIYSLRNIKETRQSRAKEASSNHLKLSTPLKKLMLIEFILTCFTSSIGAIFIIYLQDKFNTASIYDIGYAYMIPVIASSIYSRSVGRLGDRIGMIKSMIIGLVLDFVVIMIFPMFNSLLLSAGFYCISGMTTTLYNTSSNAFFSKETGISNRGSIVGTYTTVTGLGAVIGPMIGGILYKNISIAAPFYYCAVGELICAILVFILLNGYEHKSTCINRTI